MAVDIYGNLAQSTLSGNITNSQTTFSVASAASFPAVTSGKQMRIIVDGEIMFVTAISGTTFTATRGQEGTTAVAHSSGAIVANILTAGVMNNLLPYSSAISDLNMGAHNVIANGVTVGLGTASGGATYQGISINAGGNTNQANVNLNDSAGNVQFSFGSAPGPQFYISDGVAYQFLAIDHDYGDTTFNCQGQNGLGDFDVAAANISMSLTSSAGGFSIGGGAYSSFMEVTVGNGTGGFGAAHLGDWNQNYNSTYINLDDGALTINMNAGYGVFSNNYLLQSSLTGGILSGIFPDSPGLPIADWIFNCFQLQNFGLTCDSTQPGGLMRLDMRGSYPFFQLLYQPPGSNSVNDQQGPFQITSTSYGVMPSVLIGWPGAGDDNTGTGNGENLQVYQDAHIGGHLITGSYISAGGSSVQGGSFTTDGSRYWTFGSATGSQLAISINGVNYNILTSNFSGVTTLVAGTKSITITGVTSSNKAFAQLIAPGGTIGIGYKAVCTTNTLTITSETAASVTQTLDTSTLNYLVI